MAVPEAQLRHVLDATVAYLLRDLVQLGLPSSQREHLALHLQQYHQLTPFPRGDLILLVDHILHVTVHMARNSLKRSNGDL